MRFLDAEHFYHRRYWQTLGAPLLSVSVAYSLIGIGVLAGNTTAALVWITYPFAAALALWIARTAFYRRLPTTPLGADAFRRLVTGAEPSTPLRYPLRIRHVEIGDAPLCDLVAVWPPTVYVSRASLEFLPEKSLGCMLTHSRYLIRQLRSPLMYRAHLVSIQLVAVFAPIPLFGVDQLAMGEVGVMKSHTAVK